MYDLIGVGFVLFALWGSTGVAQNWRRDSDDPRWNMPGAWPWGIDTWQALYRNGVTGMLYLLTLGLTALTSGTLMNAALYANGVCILLILTVTVFNRPKFLIPPAFRDQPSLLTKSIRALRGD